MLWKVWKFFRHLVDDTWHRVRPCEELTFLGVTGEGDILPAALLDVHRIIWKMVIISRTQAEFEKKPVSPNSIIGMAIRRVIVRVRALHATHIVRSRQAQIRDSPHPKPTSVNRWTSPIAEVGKGGDLEWHPAWRRRAADFGVRLHQKERGGIPEAEGETAPQPRDRGRVAFVGRRR